jgi:hypothetical protein
VLSAGGVLYFAASTLIGLRDWGRWMAEQPNVLLVALLVTLAPLAVAWSGLWLVARAETTRGQIIKLLATQIVAWAALFVGTVYLALLRFQ